MGNSVLLYKVKYGQISLQFSRALMTETLLFIPLHVNDPSYTIKLLQFLKIHLSFRKKVFILKYYEN